MKSSPNDAFEQRRRALEDEFFFERDQQLVAALGHELQALEERHKRELRRHRIDELRAGLATLAGSYRDAVVDRSMARPETAAKAVKRIHDALEALDRNPNEQLLLQALLLELPALRADRVDH